MAVTIISLAFLSRSDVELACGSNMLLRVKTDYLAESGLEHARGLILNPQEIDDDYWAGEMSQYIEEGDFYYDVAVEPNGFCNYDISCEAYRLTQGEKTARSSLKAILRLDPAIAYWSGSAFDRQLSGAVTVNGDVYCANDLGCYGTVNGDVFCDNLSGAIVGQKKDRSNLGLEWPRVVASDFVSEYGVQPVSSTLSSQVLGPYTPVRVSQRVGDMVLEGDVEINGMLIVEGDLTVQGTGNSIIAQKNLPALLVTGDLKIVEDSELDIQGLAVVDGEVRVNIGCEDINILGGLFVKEGLFETTKDSSGNDNDAIIHGEPSYSSESGHVALNFDGDDDYLQTEDGSSTLQLTTNNYTFSVWIKADSSQKSWAGIFSKTDSDGSINHWTLQFNNNNPRKLIIHHPYGSWLTGIEIDDIAGQWHHIAVTRSGDTMTSYLDGEQKESESWSCALGSGYGHLNIGANRTASSSYLYSGLIDDVRIYNQALDVNDINEIMNGSEVTGGLIAHWKLDEDGQRDIQITAAPAKTAVYLWSDASVRQRWNQAADAFYKDIRRN
jgi:cytoskeletal protein CcmA (bactofilin family)